MRHQILIAALVLPTLLVLGAGPALADGLMSMSDPAVGTTGPQSAEGPLTLTCSACAPALSITGVASGSNALEAPAGSRICLDGAGCTAGLVFTSTIDPFVSNTTAMKIGATSIQFNGANGVLNSGASNGGSLAFNDPVRFLSTTTALLESSTAVTTALDTAFTLKPLNALDAADKVLDVQTIDGTSQFNVIANGTGTFNGTVNATTFAAKASTFGVLGGRFADGASAVGVKLGNITTLTTAGSKVAAFCADNPAICASEVASIGYDGAATFAGRVSGAGVQAVAGTEPTCDESARGLIWTVAGDTGVADTVKVCAKDAADAFAWRTIY